MATRNPALSAALALSARDPKAQALAASDAADAELRGPRGEWWWTGKQPQECPGYSATDGCVRSLQLPTTSGFTRQQLLDYFDNCWTLTEVLFASLQGAGTFVRQPYHQLRHPMMFYYGHPAVLYVNKFRVAGLLEDPIDQAMELMMETGVDEMSWDDLSRPRDDWPAVRAVHEYRQKAYRIVREVLEKHPALDVADAGWDTPAWAVFMCFEHERIHIETSSVLIRELPLECVRKPEFWPDYHPSAAQPSPAVPTEGVDFPNNDLVAVEAERVRLGKPWAYPSFGWDNEYGEREVDVKAFRASRFKVTNGEFLQFVRAGGYQQIKFWSTEGWGWRTFRNVKWPTFWIPDGPQGLHRYKLRVLFDAVGMRWDWPVDVNYHEARAYCEWKTEQDKTDVAYRLVTEAEHNLLRDARDRMDAYCLGGGDGAGGAGLATKAQQAKGCDPALNPDQCMLYGGNECGSPAGGLPWNVQLAFSSQSPVTELPGNSRGFHDVFGNAWEWAEDHYAPYPGFKVHPYYEDFSSPCFAGLHQLILGGSFISTGQLASKYARYQFRPHFFQHATFRLVLQEVDRSAYDMSRYGAEAGAPLRPFFETSCMDCPAPYVGEGPCCSVHRRGSFTPTLEEEAQAARERRAATQVVYESDVVLGQYLSLHYGPRDRVYSNLGAEPGPFLQPALDYPRSMARCLAEWASKAAGADLGSSGSALDLGCSVGGVTFQLAQHFHRVVGVDISSRFVEVATLLRERRALDYELRLEGSIVERTQAAVDEGVDTSRVTFLQGDACSLPADLLARGKFDAVVASNVIDRVPDPLRLLQQAAAALRPGGVLLLSSPFTWSEQYTTPANWVGGHYAADGQPVRTADALQQHLEADFELLASDTMPVLIAEHSRKYQLLLAHRMVLRRRA